MRDEGTPTRDEDQVDRTILVLLLDRTEGLARLHKARLICRCGEFVWPTRAAVRADEPQL